MASQGPIVVDTAEVARDVCSKLRQETVLALDCEGVDLGPIGNLTLVQISTVDKCVLIFDICTCPDIAEILREIFESDKILKIVHDCRSERSNLREQFGIQLRNVFDTQLGFLMVQTFRNNRISLDSLCDYYNVTKNPLKKMFQSDFYESNPGYWSRRPLSPVMIEYAANDVSQLHLFYTKMKQFESNERFRKMCAVADLTKDDLLENGKKNPNLRFYPRN